MSDQAVTNPAPIVLSRAAKEELEIMGIDDPSASAPSGGPGIVPVEGRPLIPKRAITSLDILNEAYDYEIPSSFSRGMRVELPGATERDYEEFNRIRTMFMRLAGLDPLPASTGIQVRLCRSDLLVEIEAMAIVPHKGTKSAD